MGKVFFGQIRKVDDHRWRIDEGAVPGMCVPGIIYSDEKMIEGVLRDNAPRQVANAACLPGIVEASMAMPDIHRGYGLPIGGVVATDIDEGGVITPGGVGYDINCGVRLIRTSLTSEEIRTHQKILADTLYSRVPTGVGKTGRIRVDIKEEKAILTEGAAWAVSKGYGIESDLENCEENGAIGGADPDMVSMRAYERGKAQSGTLGSGNHFLEVQEVDKVYDREAARACGIEKGKVVVMVHTGSRGVGHQTCGDYAQRMVRAMEKYGISMPDRQLSCVPVKSREGQAYLGAMRCAANYAWANRQVITHLIRESFETVFGDTAVSMGMSLVYDVAHNIAKIERYDIAGKERELCVHRKGATRAFPPGHHDVPERYGKTGQPVIIPGDMGSCSYLLAGTEGARETFYSTCHGAGRVLSRAAAKRKTRGRHIVREMAGKGITVRYTGRDTLQEEVPEAYKDISEVVNIVEGAGLSARIARMRPLCVIKG